MAWVIDTNALERVTQGRNPKLPGPVAEMYTFRYPVRVRVIKGGPQGMAGKYHGIGLRGPTTDVPLTTPAHHITLSDSLSASMANGCLWHELTHAAQCERYLPEEGDDYAEANRALALAFKDEMKEVRKTTGGSPTQLTMAYSKVSFEQEANLGMKFADDIDLIKITVPEKKAEVVKIKDPLTDEDGRYTWRVDLFTAPKWSKGKKIRGREFRCTGRVLAKDEWGAKKFAKAEWGKSSDEAVAYKILPIGGK